jgi:hypothetical protein
MGATDNLMSAGREPRDGFYPSLSGSVAGAGWFTLGAGYRYHFFDGQGLLDLSGSVSRKLYSNFQGRFEMGHLAGDRLTLGAQGSYQDLRQMAYFGFGNATTDADESAYRLRNADVSGYGAWRPQPWLSIQGRIGWVPRPDLLDPDGPGLVVPSTLQLFDESTAPGLTYQPSFLHADAQVVVDRTDHAGHPTTGGTYRASVAEFSDRARGTNSFRRYEVEAAQYVPLFTRRWILAVHAWGVFSDVSAGNDVPFYLMPTLGGGNTLRGFDNYRFRDRDAMVFNVESRWSLLTHVDFAVFTDLGEVASRLGDLDLTDMKHSNGVGVRLHNASSTLVRLDVGHGPDGWRVFFKLTEAFRRSTPSLGRQSVIPFVP